MKKLFYRILTSVLIFGLCSGVVSAQAASVGGASSGHWAAETVARATADGLIRGGDKGIDPDAPVTGAEMITILCRVLSADRTASLSGVTDVKASDWYYRAAAEAVALGIVKAAGGRLYLDAAMTRGGAFEALANAFQLIGAKPDTAILAQFSDSGTLVGRTRLVVAALTSMGYVKGSFNTLHINDPISLAEVLTILYRIVPGYHKGDAAANVAQDGAVISGDKHVLAGKYAEGLYFDCTTSSVSLTGVEAPIVVLRSDKLRSLSVASSRIDRLVFAAGGGDIAFGPDGGSSVRTAVVGDGAGTMTLGGISTIEVTGTGRKVVVTGAVQNLLVTGSGCTIIIEPAASVSSLQLLGAASGNAVTVNGSCGTLDIYGPDTTVDGSGTVQTISDRSGASKITVKATHQSAGATYGLNGTTLALSAPGNIPNYKTLDASVSVTAPKSGSSCQALWYIDGALISQSSVNLETTTLSINYPAKNTGEVPKTVTLSFVLYFDDPAGGSQEIRADYNIVLENANKFNINDVFSLVKTGYEGDYTLEWALAHDYDSALKTAWVNLKGFSSKTDYLVWVSIAYQRVNIFQGSAGNWTLVKTYVVGTGAPGTDTPVSERYDVIDRLKYGWTTDEYTVKPVIYFSYTGHAFHSRLYYPDTTELEDDRIGFPISHGCIRMLDDDVNWMYYNIPNGTKVITY